MNSKVFFSYNYTFKPDHGQTTLSGFGSVIYDVPGPIDAAALKEVSEDIKKLTTKNLYASDNAGKLELVIMSFRRLEGKSILQETLAEILGRAWRWHGKDTNGGNGDGYMVRMTPEEYITLCKLVGVE